MKKIIILSIILLLASGCNTANKTVTPTPPAAPATVASSTPASEAVKVPVAQSTFEIKEYNTKTSRWVPINITSKNILNAEPQIFKAPNEIITTTIKVTLDTAGGQEFAKATSDNMGKQMQIVVDGSVLSTPTVQQQIQNGSFVVTFEGSFRSAQNIANKLQGYSLNIRPLSLESPDKSKIISFNHYDGYAGPSYAATVFYIVNVKTNSEQELPFFSTITNTGRSMDEWYWIDNRYVLITADAIIAILDTNKLKTEIVLLGYGPELSKDHKTLTYTEIEPPLYGLGSGKTKTKSILLPK